MHETDQIAVEPKCEGDVFLYLWIDYRRSSTNLPIDEKNWRLNDGTCCAKREKLNVLNSRSVPSIGDSSTIIIAIIGQRTLCYGVFFCSPKTIWFTGLSGAGKTSIATGLAARLREQGETVVLLDGDEMRKSLCSDLGFSEADRRENIRRLGQAALAHRLAGQRVLVAAISPFRSAREAVRKQFALGDFVEVFVDAPLGLCETRDTKRLYGKARRGLIPEFTGIDSKYEAPEAPEVHLCTASQTLAESIAIVLAQIQVSRSQLHTEINMG